MYLPMLTNKELLVYAEQQIDDLTSTDLERELIKRMADLVDTESRLNEMLEGFEQHGFDADSALELMELANTHYCGSDVGLVEQKLQRADKLHAIVNNDKEIGTVLLDLAAAPEISVQRVYELQDHASALTQLAELANQTL